MKVLHSLILGEGSKDLIVLHGFLGMGDNWKTHAKKWAAQGWRVHLIDQRNHGRSFWSDAFSYRDLANDLKDYYQSHGLQSACVLGHSMGGKVAMLFACLYPEKVSELIVVDIAPKEYPAHHHVILAGLSALDFSQITSRQQADEFLAGYVKDLGTRQFLLKNIYRVTPLQLGLRINIEVLESSSAQIGEPLEQSAYYSGKTLFLKGANSGYIDYQDMALIHHHFPMAQLVSVENAGHWLHAENPTAFSHAIEQWWNA
ncbi:MAG: alpha/beta fold hydrolase [Flavobacteriaceae bacterium]